MTELIGKRRYDYGHGHRALEIVSIGVFFGTTALLAIRTILGIARPLDGLCVTLAALGGFVMADFLSGVAHWAGDTLGDERTPWVGKNFVRPFRYHHINPKGITGHDFIETNGNSSITSVPVLLALAWLMPKATGFWFYVSVGMLSTCWFIFCTNQFHKWAHADQAPGWVRALQARGVILSPEHHQIHHDPPHDKHYCITTGWMNPLLHKLGFFRVCEVMLDRICPRLSHISERQTAAGGKRAW